MKRGKKLERSFSRDKESRAFEFGLGQNGRFSFGLDPNLNQAQAHRPVSGKSFLGLCESKPINMAK